MAWLDMSTWDTAPLPEREWSIPDLVPAKNAGIFSGNGGTGKSIIELQKDIAHVTGKEWLGLRPVQGPAFYLGCEDEKSELHIRIATIARHYGVTFADLIRGGFYVRSLFGEDATLCATIGNKSGTVETTALYRTLLEEAGDIKPKNISIDTLSNVFQGNENARCEVTAFFVHMRALALRSGGSVTVLAHPSLYGMSSGSGLSGSTAWHNGPRFRQYLRQNNPDRDDGLRALEIKKNQYGPPGEKLTLRYDKGLYLPAADAAGDFEQAAAAAAADEVFLAILRRRADENFSSKPKANRYAPALFADDNEAKLARCTAAMLEAAMLRLLAANRIRNEQYSKPSRNWFRLVAVPEQDIMPF